MLQVTGSEAGMHLVALLPRGVDDSVIARKAAERGISAMPLSSCYLHRAKRKGLDSRLRRNQRAPDQAGNTYAQDDHGKVALKREELLCLEASKQYSELLNALLCVLLPGAWEGSVDSHLSID